MERKWSWLNHHCFCYFFRCLEYSVAMLSVSQWWTGANWLVTNRKLATSQLDKKVSHQRMHCHHWIFGGANIWCQYLVPIDWLEIESWPPASHQRMHCHWIVGGEFGANNQTMQKLQQITKITKGITIFWNVIYQSSKNAL